MKTLKNLFENNRAWAAAMSQQDPDFFARQAHAQEPQYFWIGCSDSRVAANQIVGLLPGEMFVHRNVANLFVDNNLSCLSALQFSIEVLRVAHVIVCGHYGCGGIHAAFFDEKLGVLDDWLRPVRDLRKKHGAELDTLETKSQQHDRLCELNVIEQVRNIACTSIVREAWARNQPLALHGWIYRVQDGLLRDLDVCITRESDLISIADGTH